MEKAIQSVLDQTFHEFDFIIINDGSTDNSLLKASAFKDPRIRIISQINLGVSITRNKGVTLAKNNLIAFLDADDWWEPTYLEEMKTLVENFPEAAIYGSSYFIVKNSVKKKAPIKVGDNFTSGLIDYFTVYARTLCMPVWTGATIIRKFIFEAEQGFNPILKFGEDLDLWVRVALYNKVAFLNKPLSNYNQDVELSTRAVGNLPDPDTHFLWNLDYLKPEESTNPKLKILLDKIRVYALFPYFLDNRNRKFANVELNKVDWDKQPFNEKLRYNTPLIVLKTWSLLMYTGSKLKKKVIRLKNRSK